MVCGAKLSEFAVASYTPLHHGVPSGALVARLIWKLPEEKLNEGGAADCPGTCGGTICWKGVQVGSPTGSVQSSFAADSPVTTAAPWASVIGPVLVLNVNFSAKLLPELMSFALSLSGKDVGSIAG